MILKKHIAYRFLTDESLAFEIIEKSMPLEVEKVSRGESLNDYESSRLSTINHMVSADNQKAFYITDTILHKIDMLKVNPKGVHFDWSIFNNLPDQKKTFIYSDNSLIRFCVFKGYLCFLWMKATPSSENKNNVSLTFNLFHYNQKEDRLSNHWDDDKMLETEESIYKLLCFFYFSDNESIVVEPGGRYGTRKTGKIINTFANFPITIVNSNWNITSIRTEEFGVRGHFRLQPCGPGMKDRKMIFIEPFTKSGYVKNSRKEQFI